MTSQPKDPNRRVAVSLPASTWLEIERELRERGCWWLANYLVNTNSPVFQQNEVQEKTSGHD
jgi:hypothetical protein